MFYLQNGLAPLTKRRRTVPRNGTIRSSEVFVFAARQCHISTIGYIQNPLEVKKKNAIAYGLFDILLSTL